MRLFHISDDPDIQCFLPRPADTKTWPYLGRAYVWAVSEEMMHNYFFPRNCPRVCRMIGPESSQEEKDDFRRETSARSIIFVEEARKSEIETCRLYQYEFDTRHFYPIDYSAGYYISEQAEHPIGRRTLINLLDLLETSSVDLRWVPRLEQYRRENAESNYRFSNIRMKFANHTA